MFKLLICHVEDSVSQQDRPNFCSLILWGQKKPSQMSQINKCIKDLKPTFRLSKTAVTSATELKEDNQKVLCADVNGKWVRAVPLTTTLDTDGLLEINCIDIGIKQLVPLTFLRTIPPDEDLLRSTPPLAEQYVLADVVVDKNIKTKESAIQYLKKTIENKMVNTVSLGVYNGMQSIRVYVEENMLLAKVLVDGNMAVAAASYQEAIGGDRSSLDDVKRYVSPSEISVKSTGSARSNSSVKGHYHHSFLKPETDRVIVTRVEKGPFKFIIQRNSVEAEATLTRLREQMSKVDLQPLVDTRHGVPCIVISSQDKQFYRGEIDDRPQVAAGGPSVHFVDYGLSEKYNPQMTYKMPTDMLAFEALAYRVTLADASELKNIEGIEEIFSKLVLNKTLACKVVELVSTEQLIHLYDETTGRSIKDSIINMKNSVSEANSCTPSTNLAFISAKNSLVPLNSVRADLNVETVKVDEEEDVFMTWAGAGDVRVRIIRRLQEDVYLVTFPECPTNRPILDALKIAAPPFAKYSEQPNLVGKTRALEVVHIVDPSNFYCQLNDNKHQLDDLMNELASSYEGKLKHTIRFPEVGMACVAQNSANKWYRAQVVRIIDDKIVQVRFSDYGNEEPLPLNAVKLIEEEFLVLPPQAYRCMLNELKSNVTWTPNDIARFTTATEGIKSLSGSFDVLENDVFKVRLMDNPLQGVAYVINDVFGAYPRSNVPVPTTNYSILPVAYRTSVDVSIPSHSSFDRFYLAPNPVPDVYLSGLEEMQRFYNSLSPEELVEDKPRVGLPCVVQYNEDKQFYRSRIGCINRQMAKVVLVDYGNEQDTPLKDLKRIIPSFLEIPQLAWNCRLREISENSILSCSDPIDHENDCLLAEGDYRAVFYEPDSDDVYAVDLNIQNIGDAASYLLRARMGHILRSVLVDKVGLDGSDLNEKLGFSTQTTNLPAKISVPIPSGEVYVSHVETRNIFWIQMKGTLEVIHEIEKALTNVEKGPKIQGYPKVGDVYAVKHEPTTKWLRASLLRVEGPCAHAQFLDIGDNYWVDNLDVLPCPPLLRHVAPLAVKCTFRSGVSADSDSVEGRRAFIDCTARRVCHAVFGHQLGDVVEVETLLVFAPGALNVANHLAAVLDSPR